MQQAGTKWTWRPWEIKRGEAANRSSEAPQQRRVASEQDLKFIHVSSLGDMENTSTQSEIRRHVMMDYVKHRHRRQHVETRKATSMTTAAAQESQLARIAGAQSPRTIGRSLPALGSFPIQADMRMLELVRFANEQTIKYLPFVNIWFQISLSDPGAFQVTLGNASLLWKMYAQEQDPINSYEVRHYYSKSLENLQENLGKPDKSTTLETIANIMAHICNSIRDQNWKNWASHMDGLSRISKIRGGLADMPHGMRIMLLVHDLAGAIMFDTVPRFPLPPKLQKADQPPMIVPSPMAQTLTRLRLSPIEDDAIFRAMDLVASVTHVINLQSHSNSFWHDAVAAAELIGPCIHYLLCMPRMAPVHDGEPSHGTTIVRELVRLICLMIMSKLRAKFHFATNEWHSLQTRFARFVRSDMKALRHEDDKLAIWALVTASLLEGFLEREVCIERIIEFMIQGDMSDAKAPIGVAKNILWVNVLESPFEDLLETDIGIKYKSRSITDE